MILSTYKVIKKALKIALSIVLLILLMFSILLLIFQYKPVQTWAAKKATKYLSKEWGTKVDIKSLYIKPFTSVVLEGMYVLDKQNDTLLSTPKLTVDLNKFSIFNSLKKREINFELIRLDNGSFYLKKQKDSTTNLQFILDYFNKPADTTKTEKGRPWTMNFEQIAINNFHFRYKNLLKDTVMKNRVNFNDIDVKNFTTVVNNMDVRNHLFKANVSKLTLREKSGFYVRNFRSDATIDTNQILLKNLAIRTPNSRLRNFFRMRFKTFADIDEDFEHRVCMDGDFKSSRISSKDIAYFTSTLKEISFDLGITGRVRGYVNNLRAKNLTVTAAQATYIKGDFVLKGLPDWEHTYLDLKFDQLASNKKDLDLLYSRFTGTPNRHLPEVFGKLGNINFSGSFNGYQNNFKTTGTFKTALGRFDPDVRIQFAKDGTPAYNGKIAATAFDLGTLLDNKTLGRTTFTATINGRGDEVKNLNGKVDAKFANFYFKGYQYNNVAVNGTFIRKFFDGRVTINDRNVKLDVSGTVNLNPTLPLYNITASIRNARLRNLRLLKDTITLTTDLSANFSGNSLDNINGNILLSKTRVIDPRNNYVVDSVYLSATGRDSSRTIALKSNIADGSIRGSYDLATLPSYFKTIVKKYIPSLKTRIVTPKPQNFEFNLKLKNLDPVTALFLPELKIPDQGTFYGKFNSSDRTAIFNGYVKTINYGKIKLHDFIFDESTTDSILNANISLSKVDLTDSLYINNISITNFLRRDSLNFNVKLSDKDATNQLDLYGLVEFGRDTTAKLKLLPSDVILERQTWRIEEQVRVRLLDGKTQISDFELTNGTQKVRVDGFISSNSKDELKLTFDKFSLSTLNQLTKPSGIALRGTLDGDVMFTSILKTPGIEAKLGIDSVYMNTTLIGDVDIKSNLDNNRKQANATLSIMNRGLETINIEGAYLLSKDIAAPLKFDVKMNQAEAIIFEPFVKSLVSHLKGTLSADMTLTGSFSDPLLNGNLTLANTGLTVNYLQVPYTINDKLTVENSVIKIEDLELKDGRGGLGTANGTVDLTNISNPTINVDLVAKNLMALNTNFRDNKVYFGTAYGSGTFSFKGPTDDMKIDIKANTEDGTIFNIPLNTSATAGDYDFITYVNKNDTTAATVKKEKAFKGITLNFDLTVDEKTVVRIATDYGQLEGRGTARNLKLRINSFGDFDMFGDFLIQSGKFEFTAKNFISKNFQVNEGGTIRWTGDPANAEINLKAIYEVRTNIANLYQAAGLQSPQGNKQVLVQAELLITKSLLQPTIDFNFNFPTEPSIKDDVSTYLNDYNNRSQQALSLIVRRNFAPGTGSNLTDEVFGTARDAVSEFAFNKLNNFISQSNIKNFDLNIRSFNDASASFRLLNDRLILNGSLFNNRGSNDLFSNNTSLFNSNFNNLTKDFEAQYLIRPDGRLRARYSYRVLNSTTLSTLNDQLGIQYVNGLGLVYQRDFDTFGEFWRSLFRKGRNRATTQPASTPTTPTRSSTDKKEEEPDEDEN